MSLFFIEFSKIGIFFMFSLILAFFIVFLSFRLGAYNPDTEKLFSYECGFDSYEDSRSLFYIRFCTVIILFLILYLEAAYFSIWCVSISSLSINIIFGMIDFIIELLFGFIYDWLIIGVLEVFYINIKFVNFRVFSNTAHTENNMWFVYAAGPYEDAVDEDGNFVEVFKLGVTSTKSTRLGDLHESCPCEIFFKHKEFFSSRRDSELVETTLLNFFARSGAKFNGRHSSTKEFIHIRWQSKLPKIFEIISLYVKKSELSTQKGQERCIKDLLVAFKSDIDKK